MKVGLLGNYGHANLGDEALLLGALRCASEFGGIAGSDITVLTDLKSDTAERVAGLNCNVRQLRRALDGRYYRIPMIVKDIIRSLDGLDWLVFGGGGLLNDSNPSAVPLYTLVCAAARLKGIRLAWWSVGIGPLRRGMRHALVSKMLSASDFVSVRDQASRQQAGNMLGRDVAVTPDLAHALSTESGVSTPGNPLICVSVIPYRKAGVWFESDADDYTSYCRRIRGIVRGLLRARQDLHVRLVPVSLRQDMAAIDDILADQSLACEKRLSVASPESVKDLVAEFGAATLSIATRLHSAVLSTVAGIPVIAIAYQPKVSSYVRELEYETPVFYIDTFSDRDVVTSALESLDCAQKRSGEIATLNDERRRRLRDAVLTWRELT